MNHYEHVHWIDSIWEILGPLALAVPMYIVSFVRYCLDKRNLGPADQMAETWLSTIGIGFLAVLLFYGGIVLLGWAGFEIGFQE